MKDRSLRLAYSVVHSPGIILNLALQWFILPDDQRANRRFVKRALLDVPWQPRGVGKRRPGKTHKGSKMAAQRP